MREEGPQLLVGLPECTMFSVFQGLNGDKCDGRVWAMRMKEAVDMVMFACRLYKDQMSRGGIFLCEHLVG